MTDRELLEQALDALEFASDSIPPQRHDGCDCPVCVTLATIRARLAQPDPQPVAWRTFDGEGGYDYRSYEDNEQYRDAYIASNGERYASWVEPLYTEPQTRQPLTPAQLIECMEAHGVYGGKAIAFARAIEAAHGIQQPPAGDQRDSCASDDGDEMCGGCDCWKRTRAACS